MRHTTPSQLPIDTTPHTDALLQFTGSLERFLNPAGISFARWQQGFLSGDWTPHELAAMAEHPEVVTMMERSVRDRLWHPEPEALAAYAAAALSPDAACEADRAVHHHVHHDRCRQCRQWLAAQGWLAPVECVAPDTPADDALPVMLAPVGDAFLCRITQSRVTSPVQRIVELRRGEEHERFVLLRPVDPWFAELVEDLARPDGADLAARLLTIAEIAARSMELAAAVPDDERHDWEAWLADLGDAALSADELAARDALLAGFASVRERYAAYHACPAGRVFATTDRMIACDSGQVLEVATSRAESCLALARGGPGAAEELGLDLSRVLCGARRDDRPPGSACDEAFIRLGHLLAAAYRLRQQRDGTAATVAGELEACFRRAAGLPALTHAGAPREVSDLPWQPGLEERLAELRDEMVVRYRQPLQRQRILSAYHAITMLVTGTYGKTTTSALFVAAAARADGRRRPLLARLRCLRHAADDDLPPMLYRDAFSLWPQLSDEAATALDRAWQRAVSDFAAEQRDYHVRYAVDWVLDDARGELDEPLSLASLRGQGIGLAAYVALARVLTTSARDGAECLTCGRLSLDGQIEPLEQELEPVLEAAARRRAPRCRHVLAAATQEFGAPAGLAVARAATVAELQQDWLAERLLDWQVGDEVHQYLEAMATCPPHEDPVQTAAGLGQVQAREAYVWPDLQPIDEDHPEREVPRERWPDDLSHLCGHAEPGPDRRVLVIEGHGGTGKSAFARQALAGVARRALADLDAGATLDEVTLPILVAARPLALALGQGESLAYAIWTVLRAAWCARQQPPLATSAADYLTDHLGDPRCLLLVDGLDTVPGDHRLFGELQELASRPGPQLLVTVRSARAAQVRQAFGEHCASYRLAPLSDAQVLALAGRWLGDARRAERFVAQLASRPDAQRLTGNALNVVLLCLAHREKAAWPREVGRGWLFEVLLRAMLREPAASTVASDRLASLAQSWFPADLAGHGLAEAACRHCLGDRGEVFDVLQQAGLLVPSGLDGEFSIAPRALGEHLAGARRGAKPVAEEWPAPEARPEPSRPPRRGSSDPHPTKERSDDPRRPTAHHLELVKNAVDEARPRKPAPAAGGAPRLSALEFVDPAVVLRDAQLP